VAQGIRKASALALIGRLDATSLQLYQPLFLFKIYRSAVITLWLVVHYYYII